MCLNVISLYVLCAYVGALCVCVFSVCMLCVLSSITACQLSCATAEVINLLWISLAAHVFLFLLYAFDKLLTCGSLLVLTSLVTN